MYMFMYILIPYQRSLTQNLYHNYEFIVQSTNRMTCEIDVENDKD